MATKTSPKPKSAGLDPTRSLDVIVDIPLDHLYPAPDNPRGSALGELAGLVESIESAHILEPLIVTKRGAGGYTIVAGHRRCAAAGLVGLVTVPCIVREFTEVQRFEAMAIENMQREDLTPLEEARSFQLLEQAGRTQREIASQVGVAQATVSKRLSLLKLPDTIQELVTTGRVPLREAEEIATVKPEVLELVGSPAFIKNHGGRITKWDADAAARSLKVDEARRRALKSGLIEYNHAKDGYEYDDVKGPAEGADRFRIYNDGKVAWLKLRAKKKGAGGPTPAQKAAERAKAERHAERRRFAGAHLAKLNDCALRVSLVANYHAMLRTDGDDARVVLDWLGTRNQLAKDTKGLAVTAWKALRTPSAIATKPQRLFTMAVISNVEASFENGWRGREAQGIYLATLAQLGWELDAAEKKLAGEWLEQLAADSGGIIQPTDEHKDIRTEAGQMWVEPELQPADDVPPPASCSSCSQPMQGMDHVPVEDRADPLLCDDCWEQSDDTPPEPTAPPSPVEAFEQAIAHSNELTRDRIATLPEDQQTWMAAHPEAATTCTWPHWEKSSVPALLAEIEAVNDVDMLRAAVAFEVCRNDVSRRDNLVLAGLIRIRDFEDLPDEDDMRHAALNSPHPILDHEGEPGFVESQDDIAAAEAAGVVLPPLPYSRFEIPDETRVLKTVSSITKVDTLTAAIAREEVHLKRTRVLEALRARLAAVTGQAA